MGGGLMQLVAYGAQDVYLTGNPQITFFKVVYRRHTNFACEAIEQTFNGTPDFGRKATVTIARNGDLVTKMHLKAKLTESSGAPTSSGSDWVKNLGYALVKSVELQIGGTKVDKQYGHWMQTWAELTQGTDTAAAHNVMIGNERDGDARQGGDIQLYVPLQFFCCRNDGLALPLIALQYHDVRLEFEFGSKSDCHVVDGVSASVSDASLLVNYVYLDSEERKRFAQASHEYLIEQVQFHGDETVTENTHQGKYRLNFNHPCKELVWTTKSDHHDSTDDEKMSNLGRDGVTGLHTISSAQLKLNGHDRMQEQPADYWNCVQTHQHHSVTPQAGVNVYSFALNPEEHQPSGTCNFSRIDNAELNLKFEDVAKSHTLRIYAVNYNVLRVMSGMGGLAYSN